MSDQIFQVVERYILGSPIAAGGMATVYLGRPVTLPRVVAVKQLRPEMARDQTFVRMFLDEAQLLCRIRHQHVAPPIDCFQHAGEFFIVMEYVHGQSLSQLRPVGCVPPAMASKIMSDVLTGLDAAHDAVDCAGQPLGLVHRDVSPHNILVATDGAARIVDFGVAKAAWRAHVTQHGQLKGKPGYMAPEQLICGNVDRRTDVYAAGIVLWELLTGRRLFARQSLHDGVLADDALKVVAPSMVVPSLPRALDEIVLRALSRDPSDRFPDARAMADALLDAVPPVRDFEVGAWVMARARDELRRRGELIIELENAQPSRVAERRDRDSSRPVAVSVPSAASGGPPSGYAMGQTNTWPQKEPREVRRGRRVRKGHVFGVGIGVAIVATGSIFWTRLRRPEPDAFAAGSAAQQVGAHLRIDASAALAAPSPPSSSSVDPIGIGLGKEQMLMAPTSGPPASLEAKASRRKQDASPTTQDSTQVQADFERLRASPPAPRGSALPNSPARDAVTRSYDPLRDDRRR